jgi:hypothetical protein
MKIDPLDSYDEAKYPSVKDMRSNKMSGGTKSGIAILMASLTALAMSNCNPKVENAGRDRLKLEGEPTAKRFLWSGTGSKETTETSEEYPTLAGDIMVTETNPTLAGEIMITETNPWGRESDEDPVEAGIMIAPTITVEEMDPTLAGSIAIME